ncbi:hypothetical protein GCM10028807_57790 [Spirosoma daeguense]
METTKKPEGMTITQAVEWAEQNLLSAMKTQLVRPSRDNQAEVVYWQNMRQTMVDKYKEGIGHVPPEQ